ncbi:histidine kinase [Cellulosimicrobium marinum]|uniref:histidine kinase n=1 Tax=Cellulosimicrobium marinum TaxID=1638992 RepID=UPI001E35E1E9|nr:histidine kinase [Cellulosimicrobium marinum]MCB7135185.1 histidine kinase [Cellulosimicrobium marinum]
MSSEQSPVPDAASSDTSGAPQGGAPAQEEVEVEQVLDPATVRRAPRYRAFFTVGVVLGLVVGLGLGGAWLQSPMSAPVFKPGVYFSVILVTCAALGAGVAGLWAVVADRRSMRGR